ncbi:MAG: glycosyltransferase family 61 protein [Bacteroidetes bacterium]|nr:glycosyltransferase family 61 protein [Bacteroidota bacterium]
MNNLITIPLPLNISSDEFNLYSHYRAYRFPVQKIKTFKNVFITFTGFCVNEKGLIKECHHDYAVQYDDYLCNASHYYHYSIIKPENLITLNNKTIYLAIHHIWFNYYHWICESIFRLWMVRKKLNNLTLILPEFYKDANFITASIEPFNIKNIYFIPNGKSLLVKNLCLPQLKPICDSYNVLHLKQVRKFYWDYIAKRKKNVGDKIENLYISRKKASRRKVVNEDEILRIFYKYDFTIFYPEEHDFLEQVAIFSKIKYLVGEHGSGLTNILFMNKGTSVLELHKNQTNELTHPSFLFWYMAGALGINYYHQSCKTYGKEDYFEGDYIVDPKLLEHNLVMMLSVDYV